MWYEIIIKVEHCPYFGTVKSKKVNGVWQFEFGLKNPKVYTSQVPTKELAKEAE